MHTEHSWSNCDDVTPQGYVQRQTVLRHPDAASLPVLLLGNKCDLRQAVGEPAVRLALGLPPVSATATAFDTPMRAFPVSASRPVKLFMCSVVRRTGYSEGASYSSYHDVMTWHALMLCHGDAVVVHRLSMAVAARVTACV
jgi:hypothetical protein